AETLFSGTRRLLAPAGSSVGSATAALGPAVVAPFEFATGVHVDPRELRSVGLTDPKQQEDLDDLIAAALACGTRRLPGPAGSNTAAIGSTATAPVVKATGVHDRREAPSGALPVMTRERRSTDSLVGADVRRIGRQGAVPLPLLDTAFQPWFP